MDCLDSKVLCERNRPSKLLQKLGSVRIEERSTVTVPLAERLLREL